MPHRNNTYLDDLAKRIQNRECILFVGAGLSAQASTKEGKRLPTWSNLIRQMVDWCKSNNIDIYSCEKDLLTAIEKGRLLVVAQELQDRLGNCLTKCLEELLFYKKAIPSRAHEMLVKIDWKAFMTSNYDRLLERAYAKQYDGDFLRVLTASSISRVDDLFQKGEKFILKIHGDINDTENIVLGHWDYLRLLHSEEYRFWLNNIFATNTVLFLGFGATDPDLMASIDKLALMNKQSSREHYLVVSDDEFSSFELKRLHRDQRLLCLTYPHDAKHSGLERFIEELLTKVNSNIRNTKTNTVPTLPEQLLEAEEVWLQSVTGHRLIRGEYGDFLKQKWKGRKIRLLLANPKGPLLESWNQQYPRRNMIEEIKEVVESFQSLDGCAREENLPSLRIEIRHSDQPVFEAVSIADAYRESEQGSVVTSPHSYGRSSEERDYNFFTRRDKLYAFQHQVKIFESVWERALSAFSLDVAGDIPNSSKSIESDEEYVILYITRASGERGVIKVDVDWLQDGFRVVGGKGEVVGPNASFDNWPQRDKHGVKVFSRRDLEEKVRWQLTNDTEINTCDSSQHTVNLRTFRDSLKFPANVATTLMAFPELVALIDGVDFRYGIPLFIRDFKNKNDLLERKLIPTFDPTMLWRGRNCELCGSSRIEVVHIIGPSRIVRCKECNLEYNNPQVIVPLSALDKYAEDNQHSYQAPIKTRAATFAKVFVEKLSYLRSDLIGEPLLDVGCASGEFMRALQMNHDWPVDNLLGIEPARLSIDIARRHGLGVIPSSIEDTSVNDVPMNRFGLIVVLNTIEHLPEPRKALALFRKWLRRDGILVLGNVPNSAGLMPTLGPCMFIDKSFPDGEHHYHYTPDTLEKLSKLEGFSVFKRDGRLQDIVGHLEQETAAWIAHGCGIPLEECFRINDEGVLTALYQRIASYPIMKMSEVLKSSNSFASIDDLIQFWKKFVWSDPYAAETFWLWLKLNEKQQ